jgi:hypothetical protein
MAAELNFEKHFKMIKEEQDESKYFFYLFIISCTRKP